MNAVAVVRIAKIVALIGFLLPWMLVSCSNQPIMTASGLDLGMGSFTFHNPMNGAVEHHGGTPNLLVLFAILAGIGGLVFSFSSGARDVVVGLAISSGLGLLCSWLGLALAKGAISQQLAGEAARQRSDVSLQGLLNFQTKLGFTVTALGYAAALAVALFAIWSRRSGASPEAMAETFARRSAGFASESLHQAVAVLSQDSSGPRAPANRFCGTCGNRTDLGAKFCSGCGSSLLSGAAE